IFIAEEVHTLKKELRERYKSELESIKDKTIQFVIFEVGGESYAVEISVVKEVVPLPMLSKTPNTPDHIKGIANIRGATYTVYDLAEKFKVKGDQLAKFLLVIGKSEVPASLMIGSLPSTLKIKGSEVSGSMDMIEDATLDVSFIKGIIHHEQKLVYYLDVVELLKNDKAIIVPDKYLRRAE
ncbi:MAG: chemotaxis protein CheW, partial [Ekhidna sp.]|nr:chemotaxis protein CheW [Ekhidna sp.]